MSMSLKIFGFLILILSFSALASQDKKIYELNFESLNNDLLQELLHGDVAKEKRSLYKKINALESQARSIYGKKFSRLLAKNFKHTVRFLSRLDKTHKEVLDLRFENGLTGREVIVKALDPKSFIKLQSIYEENQKDLSKTLLEAQASPDFDFLDLKAERNYVLQEQAFNFFASTCQPKFGEEDFFLVLFGFERCESNQYQLDRYTVGLGYINSVSGQSYMTGLKIGKKSFFGVGARVKIGISYAGGIGVFIGNGLIITVDLDKKTYGLYAGATFAHMKVK
jgi:hypothetical protein